MVRDKETFFPAHEHAVAVAVSDSESWPSEFLLHLLESGKAGPMSHILVLIRTPIVGEEAVSGTNNLRVKVCSELRPVIRKTTDTKVATEER